MVSFLQDLRFNWRPQGDLNPCCPAENGMPLACQIWEHPKPIGKNKGLAQIANPFNWRPQGDLNPCCRRERPVSLAD
jgi:hypothetical protein